MPAALDPDNTFTIVLPDDQEKPEGKRPGFIYNFLTGRQWFKVAQVQELLPKCKNMTAVFDLVFGGCRIGLKGWENITGLDGKPMEFDPDKLEDVLTLVEAQELVLLLEAEGSLGSQYKKKLDSLLLSKTEPSASDAQDQENAKTSQP